MHRGDGCIGEVRPGPDARDVIAAYPHHPSGVQTDPDVALTVFVDDRNRRGGEPCVSWIRLDDLAPGDGVGSSGRAGIAATPLENSQPGVRADPHPSASIFVYGVDILAREAVVDVVADGRAGFYAAESAPKHANPEPLARGGERVYSRAGKFGCMGTRRQPSHRRADVVGGRIKYVQSAAFRADPHPPCIILRDGHDHLIRQPLGRGHVREFPLPEAVDAAAFGADPEAPLPIGRHVADAVVREAVLFGELIESALVEAADAPAECPNPQCPLRIQYERRGDLAAEPVVAAVALDDLAATHPRHAAHRADPESTFAVGLQRPDQVSGQPIGPSVIRERAVAKRAEALMRADPQRAVARFADCEHHVAGKSIFR